MSVVMRGLCWGAWVMTAMTGVGPGLWGNVVGSDFQTFHVTTHGLDFVTVSPGHTLSPGVFNLGLFFNYAANAVPEFVDRRPVTFPRGSLRNASAFSDLNLGVGLLRRWEVGLSLPAILHQSIREDTSRIEHSARGVSEIRLNTRVGLLGGSVHGLALGATANFNRVDPNPYVGDPSRPGVTGEAMGHASIGALKVGLNAGYRWRNPGAPLADFPVTPLVSQWIYSAAASYFVESLDTKLLAEVYGGQAVAKAPAEAAEIQRSLEALLGVKVETAADWSFHAGLTTGLVHAPATPDWRIYAGVNWDTGPWWGRRPARRGRPEGGTPAAPADAGGVVPPPAVGADEVFVLENILFANDSSSKVLKGAFAELAELAEHLRALGSWERVIVEGHTDSVASDAYNLELSQRRANAVRQHLIDRHGIAESKIAAQGFGERYPIADNSNFQGRQTNRRVEIKIFVHP